MHSYQQHHARVTLVCAHAFILLALAGGCTSTLPRLRLSVRSVSRQPVVLAAPSGLSSTNTSLTLLPGLTVAPGTEILFVATFVNSGRVVLAVSDGESTHSLPELRGGNNSTVAWPWRNDGTVPVLVRAAAFYDDSPPDEPLRGVGIIAANPPLRAYAWGAMTAPVVLFTMPLTRANTQGSMTDDLVVGFLAPDERLRVTALAFGEPRGVELLLRSLGGSFIQLCADGDTSDACRLATTEDASEAVVVEATPEIRSKHDVIWRAVGSKPAGALVVFGGNGYLIFWAVRPRAADQSFYAVVVATTYER